MDASDRFPGISILPFRPLNTAIVLLDELWACR